LIDGNDKEVFVRASLGTNIAPTAKSAWVRAGGRKSTSPFVSDNGSGAAGQVAVFGRGVAAGSDETVMLEVFA
jgi:hypothetical protein